ncbi:hypothetical protein V2H45_24875 [Tumidithrix elongata RA019]|uniref:PepSY domain-containing protein n=1 Tax=Tumidithrix elongata BACA0141 TaxID=2716417 RepID=A0AAW9PYC8_9CYAN|nr:hypothetical protein [Tumidithrix elongata RA019]
MPIQEAIDRLKVEAKQEMGAYKSLQAIENNTFRIVFERGTVVARLQLDRSGRIAELSFENPEKF